MTAFVQACRRKAAEIKIKLVRRQIHPAKAREKLRVLAYLEKASGH